MILKENPPTNEFSRDLDESYRVANLPFWEEVYRQLWPDFEDWYYHLKDTPEQLSGIDRTLIWGDNPYKVDTGKAVEVHIDEKVRTRNKITGKVYSDIALEIYSDKDKKTEGWITKPTGAHFFNYVILPRGEAYIYPVDELQTVWDAYGQEWIKKYGVIHPRNVEKGRQWTAECCPVPPGEIAWALRTEFEGFVSPQWLYTFDVPEGEDKEESHD